MTSRVLQVLEALDRHSFDRVDSTNSVDSLYVKIFPTSKVFLFQANGSISYICRLLVGGSKGNPEPASVEQVAQYAKQDEPFVRLLCQWAVSDQRYGEHRAMAAALLLEKRQADLVALTESDSTGADDNETEENSSAVSVLLPVYQVSSNSVFLPRLSC